MTTTNRPVLIGPPAQPERRRRRHRVPSWALKTAMAVTGAVWAAFVAIHLFGNLKVFQGAEAFNTYAAWLREAFYPLVPHGFVLWTMRVVLLIALVIHVVGAATLWVRGRRARGPHRARITGARSWGSWLMPVTGVALLGFVGFHLLDLTLGIVPAASDGFAHPSDGTAHAYENLVASYQRPGSAWFYVAVMLLLALHIAKGFTTMAADLGVTGRRVKAGFAVAGGLLAVAVLLANGAIPALVQLGVIS